VSNVVPLSEHRPGSYLGTVSFYRMPDGQIAVALREMAVWQIEAKDTIPERFREMIDWMQRGVASLEEQALAFEEPTP